MGLLEVSFGEISYNICQGDSNKWTPLTQKNHTTETHNSMVSLCNENQEKKWSFSLFVISQKEFDKKKKGSSQGIQGIVSEVGEPEFWLHVSTDSKERKFFKKYTKEKRLYKRKRH